MMLLPVSFERILRNYLPWAGIMHQRPMSWTSKRSNNLKVFLN